MVQAGQRLSQLASTMDIFPTALELAGVKPPEGRPLDNHPQTSMFAKGEEALAFDEPRALARESHGYF